MLYYKNKNISFQECQCSARYYTDCSLLNLNISCIHQFLLNMFSKKRYGYNFRELSEDWLIVIILCITQRVANPTCIQIPGRKRLFIMIRPLRKPDLDPTRKKQPWTVSNHINSLFFLLKVNIIEIVILYHNCGLWILTKRLH